MAKSKLYEAFHHLSQHSVDSVQNGMGFTDWDEYMHVDRPIESKLMEKMDEIDKVGGGIILLVGSAGDGKSHMISRIKQMSDWDDNSFYNDATASCSPQKTAMETLKEALIDFNDENLDRTTKKLVLAINLGKLNEIISDDDFKQNYQVIVNSTLPIFDNDDTKPPIDTERVKIVLFKKEQIFEFYPNSQESLPVKSSFLSKILEKIVVESTNNPFFVAYKSDLESGISKKDPILLNYQLLCIPEIRHTIVMTVIESIIRYNLQITPREFLDFIFSIIVFPFYSEYKEKNDFYEALLPSLLYGGTENMIQKAVYKLDPLKQNSTQHDKTLSILYTSNTIPKTEFSTEELNKLPSELLVRTNEFYSNNGRDLERTTKFIFRLKHLLNYHSESNIYTSYISLLKGIFKEDTQKMQEIYSLVSKTIPRHYGSYYDKTNMIPLNIQGGRYKLFANLQLKPIAITNRYTSPNEFYLRFYLSWSFPNKNVALRMDYQLYSYLYELNCGKLAMSYENEKDMAFSKFVRQLSQECNCEQDVTVVRSDAIEMKLSELSFGNIE